MPRLNRHSRFPLGRSLLVTCGFTLTIFICVVALYRPTFLAHLDGRFFDGLIAEEVPPEGYTGPIVVALDDESLARFGRWPWPRALVARLLTRIAVQEPASVGIDAIFAEREIPIDSREVPDSAGKLSPGDLAMTQALASAPFVLGYELLFAPQPPPSIDERLLPPLHIVAVSTTGATDPGRHLWQATGVVSSLPEFSRSVAGSGFLNAAV
ncbi:MAG TPA: CHASE2 domain-containing protein, partial [Geobacteraceae bacterium]